MRARTAALRLLSRRDYTTAEIRQKLTDREFEGGETEEAIASLRADRLIDDRRAAAAHIRTASRIKQRGRIRIERELEARGVDRSLIRELLRDLPAEDESAAIAKFLQRRRPPGRLNPADRRRLFQQLLRRGFTPDVIAKALKRDAD